MKYIAEFLFRFVFIAAFMFFFTALFNVWTDAERPVMSIAFALGAALVGTITSAVQNRASKKK